jgi:outer membrane protein assembly factor BamB
MMKKLILLFEVAFLCIFSANAQLTEIWETKMQAAPGISTASDGKNFFQAGTKMFEVIDLASGSHKVAKTYKETGAAIEKAFSAVFSETAEFLVVCDDKKTVACIDVFNGKKVWENSSFFDLGSDETSGSLAFDQGVVIVTDKKAKGNYTITCLDEKTGKQLWTVENETDKVDADNVFITSDLLRTTSYAKKGDKTSLKLFNLQSGKNELSAEMEGSAIFVLNVDEDYVFVHHRISEKKSFVSAIDLKAKKVLWKSNAANISSNLPLVMNTNTIRYYAKMEAFEGKVLLMTEGIEAFDIATGKSVYNIPFVPYYKWGVGHYIDAIFTPVVTDHGILLADATKGDIYIRYYDRETGKLLWSGEKQKNVNVSPMVNIFENTAVVQFGGVCVFEVMNNSDIGKFLDPYAVTAFDLTSGKVLWNIDSKKEIFATEKVKNNLMIIGKKDLQTIDAKTGTVVKEEKNPFDDSYFMTKVGLENRKVQKDVSIDYENRIVIRVKDNKVIKSKF